MKAEKNVLLIGYRDHGKDFVAKQLLEVKGYDYRSSSLFVAERVIFPVLAPKYNYTTVEECYQDRGNHRDEWYQLILAYNKDDGARLAKEILAEAPVYVGMRSRREFEASMKEGLFDLVIWVDRSDYESEEPTSSNELTPADADIVLNNNRSVEQLRATLFHLF